MSNTAGHSRPPPCHRARLLDEDDMGHRVMREKAMGDSCVLCFVFNRPLSACIIVTSHGITYTSIPQNRLPQSVILRFELGAVLN